VKNYTHILNWRLRSRSDNQSRSRLEARFRQRTQDRLYVWTVDVAWNHTYLEVRYASGLASR
jgi:hypothetical protein